MNRTLEESVRGKKVLFITTKNIDYIRNTQEIRILEEYAASVDKIFSSQKSYVKRILAVWKAVLTYRMSDAEVVFVGFSPQLLLPFFLLGKFRKKMVIIDFFISVYDTFVNDRKKFRKKGLLAGFSHWLDSYVINVADSVIVDTNADKEYFQTEFGGNRDKFETLYLEADKTVYYPRKQNKQEHLKDKFVVLYFGSILPLQGVDIVLEAVRLLKGEERIYFQIIGPIPKEYDKPVQDNVEYTNWLSQEKLAEAIASSDLCLAGHFCAEIDKAQRTIAGKTYIYAAMHKAMILGDNRANRELFEESETIRFVKMGDAVALSETIFSMCQ